MEKNMRNKKGSYIYSPQIKNILYWVLITSWRKFFPAALPSLNWCKTIRIDTRTSISYVVHLSQRFVVISRIQY